MNKNLILFSTGVFIDSSNNRDHTLITKLIPNLVSPGFEIHVSKYFVENQDEYEKVAQDIMQAKKKGAFFPVMHVVEEIG